MNLLSIILLAFISIFYFMFGIIVSKFVDYIFPDCDLELPKYRIFIESAGELFVVYIIYFIIQRNSIKLINYLYKIVALKAPSFINSLCIMLFSFAVFEHLYKVKKKNEHLQEHVKIKISNIFSSMIILA
jgi:transposase